MDRAKPTLAEPAESEVIANEACRARMFNETKAFINRTKKKATSAIPSDDFAVVFFTKACCGRRTQ
jgi:hypothetical protein